MAILDAVEFLLLSYNAAALCFIFSRAAAPPLRVYWLCSLRGKVWKTMHMENKSLMETYNILIVNWVLLLNIVKIKWMTDQPTNQHVHYSTELTMGHVTRKGAVGQPLVRHSRLPNGACAVGLRNCHHCVFGLAENGGLLFWWPGHLQSLCKYRNVHEAWETRDAWRSGDALMRNHDVDRHVIVESD